MERTIYKYHLVLKTDMCHNVICIQDFVFIIFFLYSNVGRYIKLLIATKDLNKLKCSIVKDFLMNLENEHLELSIQ